MLDPRQAAEAANASQAPARIARPRPSKAAVSRGLLAVACLALLAPAAPAFSQGQDSTPAERDVLVLAELLARVYDNYNQVYFDRRIGYPKNERHDRIELRIDRVGGPDSMLLAFREFSGGDYSALTPRRGAGALAG